MAKFIRKFYILFQNIIYLRYFFSCDIMKEYDGNVLQAIKEDFSLQDVLHPNFIEKLIENFGDEEFSLIKMIFISKNQPKTLTLFYPTHRHTKDKKLVVDVDVPEDLDKLYFALDFEDNYD